MAFSPRFVEVDGCRINLRRGGSGEPPYFALLSDSPPNLDT